MVTSNPWVHQKKFVLPRILVVASLLMVLLLTRTAYAQQDYAPDSLFIVLFSDGTALVEYDIRVQNPLADAVSVNLFGATRTSLIITDFEDTIITSRTGERPGEIVIAPAGASDIRISYSTQDLISKVGREWTFAIDSPVSFSIKMPPDSTPIEFGGAVPDFTSIGSQTLLTFPAGNHSVTYIVGFVDSETAADNAIRFASSEINQAKNDNPGIILTGAQELIAEATAAKEAGQFIDAQDLAIRTVDRVETTAADFQAAIEARTEARTRIVEAEGQNRDVAGANALFDQSSQQFEAGDYARAADSAEDAVRAIGEVQQNVWPYGIGVVVAGATAGAFYVLKKRQTPKQQATFADQDIVLQDSEPVHWPEPAPSVPDTKSKPGATEAPTKPAIIPDSQVDRDMLARIVHRIIEERSHLRQEDRDVLVFLAQNEGAAFESEVRTKFQLPKTTVWRLVKRLEREELVEIRKAGGQNLIKLRFEGRQP